MKMPLNTLALLKRLTLFSGFFSAIKFLLLTRAEHKERVTIQSVLQLEPGDVYLGQGKDGVVVKRTSAAETRIVKVLSSYAKRFLPRVQRLAEIQRAPSPLKFLFPLAVSEHTVSYPFESLEPYQLERAEMLSALKSISELQSALLQRGWIWWDFGNDHFNFMKTEAGELRVIDYGGNGFIPLESPDRIPQCRPMLAEYNEYFMKACLLLFITEFIVGEKNLGFFRTACQFSERASVKTIELLENRLRSSSFEKIFQLVQENPLNEVGSWRRISKELELLSGQDNLVLEGADIDEITEEGDGITVKGYQHFFINKRTSNINILHSKDLWDTKQKAKFVCDFLESSKEYIDLTKSTFLDIGCNLGLYVYLANINYKLKYATGVDYNKAYIETNKEVLSKLSIGNASFKQGSFSQVDGEYDLVVLVGLIHHLFQRTEQYGNLGSILECLSRYTKQFALIEFPDENDPKAKKWSALYRAESEYSLKEFEKQIKIYFKSYLKIGKMADTRHMYIVSKNEILQPNKK